MKKILIIFVTFILLLLIPTPSVLAQQNETRKIVKVSSDEIVEKDFFLATGEIVEISGKVMGDVIVAGGQVLVNGVIDGDLLAVGGAITISGEVAQNVRIAGGQVTISGDIGRNLTVFAGDVEINDTAKIGGGALVTGGNLLLDGEVGGDLLVGSGNLTIASKVGGDVEVATGTLNLTSEAQVGGNLMYFSEEEALIDEAASVSGKITKKQPPEYIRTQELPAVSNFFTEIAKRRFETQLISFTMALVFGLVLLRLYPKYVNFVGETISNKLWQSLGVGLLALIGLPIVIVILLSTVVGMPFAMFALFIYLTGLYLAKIFVAVCIGNFLYKKINKKKTQYMPFVLGLIVYYALRVPPYIGGLTGFVVLLLGLGAKAISYKEVHKKLLKANII